MAEEVKVGAVTHFFGKVSAGIVNLTDGELKVGDNIHIKGHTSDFTQMIESMQIDHKPVQAAPRGAQAAIIVKEHVREHDVVYKVLS